MYQMYHITVVVKYKCHNDFFKHFLEKLISCANGKKNSIPIGKEPPKKFFLFTGGPQIFSKNPTSWILFPEFFCRNVTKIKTVTTIKAYFYF